MTEHGTYVYYSGWNQAEKRGQLLLAAGPDSRKLQKRGIMLAPMEGYENPKEATLAQVPDGSWRLFFEYADDGASKIGLASGPAVNGPWTMAVNGPWTMAVNGPWTMAVNGPWTMLKSPVEARAGHWDSYHLSPGPVYCDGPECSVIFYNGANEET